MGDSAAPAPAKEGRLLMRENHPNPDPPHVYHDRPRGIPRLVAFCADGLDEHHYLPHALGDDIVYAWGVRTRDEITLYLLPDPGDGSDTPHGAAAGPYATIDEAHARCAEETDEPLRIIWI